MKVIDDNDIDFDQYLRIPADAARVKPASTWCRQVIDSIYDPAISTGAYLPWSKTKQLIRLRPAELSVWAGVNGHGKSLLLNQIMLAVMAQDERVCIASMEMKPAQTMRRMTRQAVAVEEPSIEFIKGFHAWTDGRLWLYDQQGTVKANRLLAVVRYCTEELKITHFVIDSLMKCGLGVDDYNGQKRLVDELSTHAKDTGTHIHLIAHSRKRESQHTAMDKFDVKGAGEITDMADNVFTLWQNKQKEAAIESHEADAATLSEADALLICDKQRNGEWEGRIALWFDRASLIFIEHQNARPSACDVALSEAA